MLLNSLPSLPSSGEQAGRVWTSGSAPRWVVHAHGLLGSTSDEARRLAREGAPFGTVVRARAQTAGRGRQGRTWSSPEGNLHMSVVLGCAEAVAPQLGFVAALAVADAVDETCGRARVRLKWPNDVMLEGGKLGGLLLEVEQTAHGPAVVLGIGVNLCHFPADARYAATSLRSHGVEVTAEAITGRVLRSLEVRLDEWATSGFGRIREAWVLRGHGHGDSLRIGGAGKRVDATFVGLDPDGSLLALVDGKIERFTSAEILSAYTKAL